MKPGWNDIAYLRRDEERQGGGHYKIYLSFFAVDESNAKAPLAEPFYVDGIWAAKLDGAGSAAPGGPVGNWLWAMGWRNLPDTRRDNTGAKFQLESGGVRVAFRRGYPERKSRRDQTALDLVGQRRGLDRSA